MGKLLATDSGRRNLAKIILCGGLSIGSIVAVIDAFGISRSLSNKGNPIDNAVAESMYNIVKTEFAFGESFHDLDDLQLRWFDYVNWHNNVRIHGSLNYLTPDYFASHALENISI